MSMEIREMIVRTTLTDSVGGKTEKIAANSHNAETNTEHIIEQCVARIMEMIEEENEK